MASAVDICNMALGFLGDRATVTAIDPPDGSVQADHCARYYPIALNALLEMHPWNFAATRANLIQLSNSAQPESWEYTFAYPPSCARIVKLIPAGAGDDDDPAPFETEILSDGTQVIYSNVEEASVVYIKRVTDTGAFPFLFITALARLLAVYLAGPLIKGGAGVKVAEGHRSIFLKIDLPTAMNADAAQRRTTMWSSRIPKGIAARA